MAKQLRAQIDIHASPKRVWQVLTDFASYPQGNPFMTRAAGNPARAVWAFAHGMVQLELARRFPPGADLDTAWQEGITASRTRMT